MGFKEKLSTAFHRVGKEAGEALDKGKAKVEELQIEMKMDGLAKKLGYLTFDSYRGRQVDEALRQKYLDELSKLEEQAAQAKAEAAAKAEAEAPADTAVKAAKAAEEAAESTKS